jgi:hypothetical protein
MSDELVLEVDDRGDLRSWRVRRDAKVFLDVEARREEGVLVLTVLRLDPQLFFLRQGVAWIGRAFLLAYREGQAASCVLQLQGAIGSSALVKALYQLRNEVVKGQGQLIVVGFHGDYVDLLAATGLPALQGFSLASTLAEALQRLKAVRPPPPFAKDDPHV